MVKEINLSTKIAVYPLEDCTETEKKLIEAAKKATEKAYAPYSGFSVGAALLLENGEIVSGNNQENAQTSYTVSLELKVATLGRI